MADITYADKAAGSTFSHEDANEIKTAVNTKVDKVTSKGLSTNDYDNTEKAAVAFAKPVTIAYQTEIPFTRMLTIITGKTLASNDTLTIGANPVEGAGAQTWLDGNGTNTPVLTAFDYQSGEFDNTAGVRNLITMEYLGAKSYISILNMTTV